MSEAARRGALAEKAVADCLRRQGYEICDANYAVSGLGELDLIIRKAGRLTFVEVKARSNAGQFGGLPATITSAKLRRLRRTAACYLKEKRLMNSETSFLAAFVQLNRNGETVDVSFSPIEWV